MEEHPFIFSDQLKYRFWRHISFWLFWGLFLGFLYSYVSGDPTESFSSRLSRSILDSFAFLPSHIFLSYSLMYFVIPRFIIKQRYGVAAFWIIVLFFITALISFLIGIFALPTLRYWFFDPEIVKKYIKYQSVSTGIWFGLMAGLRGGITIGGIAAAIKLMKYWYVKEQRNLQLQKENIATQLQLLKAQVHPHFLFNTLNNIYSYSQSASPVTPSLIMGLSDMLRYILYECNKPLVPLSKEIKMLQDYCSLEKVRYDNHLDLQLDVPVLNDELLIAPLLLLPFAENCFKHGASNLLENAWVSISIKTEGNQLKVKMINSKPLDKNNNTASGSGGLGISNVKTRLHLLYEGKYELQTTTEEDIYIVTLQLQLERQPLTKSFTHPEKKPAVYEHS